MNKQQVLRRVWTRDNSGNKWYYTAHIKWPLRKDLYQHQLAMVQRITETNSPNFNRWIVEIAFHGPVEPFLSKRAAIAYATTVVGLGI